jgi:hypothetical protein
VTSTRFPYATELDEMAAEAATLYEYCKGVAQRGSVQLMGIDFGKFAALVARTNLLLS